MSTDYLAPTTELEAVNIILAAIGETPVGTLSGALPVDASTALLRLRNKSRSLQTEGWSFNSDDGFTLPKDNAGKVPVPVNALNVDATDSNDYVVRGQFFYDRTNHTFFINKDIKADIVRFLPWDDLPEYARNFVFISVARTFQDQMLGDESLHQFTQEDERVAWASFLNSEARNADLNVLTDNYTISRIFRRRSR